MTDVTIRPMAPADAEAVLALYQAGLDGGNASFEITAPTWEAFDTGRLDEHRFVATGERDEVLGWVAVTPVSARPVYAGVVEHSIYVSPAAQGRGVGRALLEALIESTERAGIWTIQSGVFPENTPSLALHRACGFRTVGIRSRLGKHGDRWRDVVLLERRSPDRESPIAAFWATAGALPAGEVVATMDGLAGEDAAGLFERASARDFAGREAEAEPLYRAALAAGLDDDLRPQAVIQLASTLRNLGRAAEAVTLLTEAGDLGAYEDERVAFLALALVDAGDEKRATALAVRALATHAPHYGRALTAYAEGL